MTTLIEIRRLADQLDGYLADLYAMSPSLRGVNGELERCIAINKNILEEIKNAEQRIPQRATRVTQAHNLE